MDKTNILMYLTYWFDKNENEKEIIDYLMENGLNEFEFKQTKNGDCGVKFSEIRMETLYIEDVIDLFLRRFNSKIKELNLFSKKYKGFYVIEIVPEIYDMENPALIFEKKFLDFIKRINHLKQIDIDQYIY